MSIGVTLTPQAQALIARVDRFPASFPKRIGRRLDLENELTIGHIQATKLSRRGPRTLGVVTNRLRGSLRKRKATVRGNGRIISAIGTNVVYAGVHEFGFKGRVSVRAHVRKGGVIFGRVQTSKEKIFVRAHSRRVRIKERAPIRRGIEERAGKYRQSLSTEIVLMLSKN